MEVIAITYSQEESLATFVYLAENAKEKIYITSPTLNVAQPLPYKELINSENINGNLGGFLQRIVKRKIHLYLLASEVQGKMNLSWKQVSPFGKILQNEITWLKFFTPFIKDFGTRHIAKYNICYAMFDDKYMMIGSFLKPQNAQHKVLTTTLPDVCVIVKPTTTLCDFVQENFDRGGCSRRIEHLFLGGRIDLQPRNTNYKVDSCYMKVLELIQSCKQRLIIFTEAFCCHPETKNEIVGVLVKKIADSIRQQTPFECCIITNNELIGHLSVVAACQEYNLTAKHFENCFLAEGIHILYDEKHYDAVTSRLFIGSLKTSQNYQYWRGSIIQGDDNVLYTSGALTDTGLELKETSQLTIKLNKGPQWEILLGIEPRPLELHKAKGQCCAIKMCEEKDLRTLQEAFTAQKTYLGNVLSM